MDEIMEAIAQEVVKVSPVPIIDEIEAFLEGKL